MSATIGSQNLLAGADNTLDNFFKSGLSRTDSTVGLRRPSSSTSSTKRKARLADADEEELPMKKSRLSSSETKNLPLKAKRGSGAGISTARGHGSPKSKNRSVLSDLTSTLQNSPRKPRQHLLGSRTSPTQRKSRPMLTSGSMRSSAKSSKETTTSKSPSVVETTDEEEHDSDSSQQRKTTIARTPHHSSKDEDTRHRSKVPLPTPPSSSVPASRVQPSTEGSCSPVLDLEESKDGVARRPLGLETPFTFSASSARQVYPTPTSIVIPRLRPVARDGECAKDQFSSASSPVLGSDSLLSSLTCSTNSSQEGSQMVHEAKADAQSETNVEAETANTMEQKSPKRISEDKSKTFMVVPSSQTQYIHYSPTKQRYGRTFPDSKLKPLSLTVIPSSQPPSSPPTSSQTITLSPRKTRKPRPIVTPGPLLPSEEGTSQRTKRIALNFVVPTSQEDEKEIHLLDDVVPAFSASVKGQPVAAVDINGLPRNNSSSQDRKRRDVLEPVQDEHTPSRAQATAPEKDACHLDKDALCESTQMRFINAVLDDLNRLADETRANLVTVSQVLSRSPGLSPPIRSVRNGSRKVSLTSKFVRHEQDDSQEEDYQPRDSTRDQLFMQSSITEPDASQWDDDPFSPTNGAYAKHISLPRHSDRGEYSRDASDRQRTYTQSSTTQPDTQEDDPFPTLPPSTAESTADRVAVDDLLLSPRDQRDAGRSGRDGSFDQSLLRESNQIVSETQPDSEDKAGNTHTPMPDISSPDDTFDVRLITPRTVRRAVFSSHTESKFRRRSNCSFNGSSEGNSQVLEGVDGRGNENEGDVDSMPSPLRHFLEIFSQTWSLHVVWYNFLIRSTGRTSGLVALRFPLPSKHSIRRPRCNNIRSQSRVSMQNS